jgi:GNAT superfamily N-acetyltransferase
MTTQNPYPGQATFRPTGAADHAWIADLLREYWGSTKVVTRGRVHDADRLPGFIAEVDRWRGGLVSYRIEDGECEIVSLNSLREGLWIGSVLLEKAAEAAREAGCRRMWLVTTNDNVEALRFYQKRGWRLVAVYPNAIEESRKLKPEIPRNGNDGIPIRDEIELELPLEPD